MKIFFGIDGGGTSTRIKMENENGDVLFQGKSSSANMFAVGQKAAVDNVLSLIKTAILEAKLSCECNIYGCIGAAGLGRTAERDIFQTTIKETLPNANVLLTTDGEILLAGGLNMEPGIALIAGTGSIALAKDDKEQISRSGGMGWRLGDEGSAWWIAHEAIRRTLRSIEGRDIKTTLTQRLLDHYKLKEVSEFISFINSDKTEKSVIASGARLVTEEALRGDLLSIDILDNAAEELKLLVISLVDKAGPTPVKLVTYGGVLDHDEYINSLLRKKLQPFPVKPVSPIYSALEGALMLAKRQAE